MPLDALPDHLRDIEHNFPDDDQFGTTWFGYLYRWYQKTTKTWFAFSYRCKARWARWREYPKVLFAVGGKGPWRWEAIRPPYRDIYDFDRRADQPAFYSLSRIQYFKRWHVAIQWPLIISAHVYPKAEDVPKMRDLYPDLDGKLWFFYWNHFDADLVYWMVTSLYIGRNWK